MGIHIYSSGKWGDIDLWFCDLKNPFDPKGYANKGFRLRSYFSGAAFNELGRFLEAIEM